MNDKWLKFWFLLAAGGVLASSPVLADDSYFLGTTTTKSTQPRAAATNPSVASPTDFSARVQKLQQQNQSKIKSQIDSSLANTPPVKTPDILTKPLPVPMAAPGTKLPPETSIPPLSTQAAPAPAPAPMPSAPPPQQPVPYTGFQSQPAAAPSGGSGGSQQGQGGWGIKYFISPGE